MDPSLLISRFPRLYHTAEDGSWRSILSRGLLSTTALLDLFEVEGEQRYTIQSCRRPEKVSIEHPEFGSALIRDNKPMQEKVLEPSLVGMTAREWYETLNRKVFFWVSRDRLRRFLCARSYRSLSHIVLEVDTSKLLERHVEKVTLSRINSGATFAMNPAPRGPDTFRLIADFPADGKVVELAVDYAVPNISELVLSVSRWKGGEMLEKIRSA